MLLSESNKRFIMRSVRTRVLPLPAPAATRRVQFLVSIADCWAGVKFILALLYHVFVEILLFVIITADLLFLPLPLKFVICTIRQTAALFRRRHNNKLFFSLLFTYNKLNRRSLETKHLSELVFDIPLVRKVKKLGVVAENNKCRRFDTCLCHVVYL